MQEKEEINLCLINREYETNNERVLTFTNVELPEFVNYSIFYREYNLEGYKVIIEKLQNKLNYFDCYEYVEEQGARLLASNEICLLIEQQIEKSSNKNDPFSTL